jgi:hypothetical protein
MPDRSWPLPDPPLFSLLSIFKGCKQWFFTHHGSRIPDLGSRTQKPQQKRGVKKIVVIPFFVATNFTKNLKLFYFWNDEEKIWPSFQRIIELFTQNLSLSSKKYGFGIRDLRSGIRNKPIPDPGPGSRGQKGTGSQIRYIGCKGFFSSVAFKMLTKNKFLLHPSS